jgi:hypothetical protein
VPPPGDDAGPWWGVGSPAIGYRKTTPGRSMLGARLRRCRRNGWREGWLTTHRNGRIRRGRPPPIFVAGAQLTSVILEKMDGCSGLKRPAA